MDKKTRPKNPDEVQMTLRLTRAQHARLRALAEADSRSLHGQIVHFINEGIGRQEQRTGERAGHDGRAAAGVRPEVTA